MCRVDVRLPIHSIHVHHGDSVVCAMTAADKRLGQTIATAGSSFLNAWGLFLFCLTETLTLEVTWYFATPCHTFLIIVFDHENVSKIIKSKRGVSILMHEISQLFFAIEDHQLWNSCLIITDSITIIKVTLVFMYHSLIVTIWQHRSGSTLGLQRVQIFVTG